MSIIYNGQPPALHGSSHSYSEDTGFTHAQNIDPITFRPPETFVNDLSPQVTWRPTGSTVMRKDFTAPPQLTVSRPPTPASPLPPHIHTHRAVRGYPYCQGGLIVAMAT